MEDQKWFLDLFSGIARLSLTPNFSWVIGRRKGLLTASAVFLPGPSSGPVDTFGYVRIAKELRQPLIKYFLMRGKARDGGIEQKLTPTNAYQHLLLVTVADHCQIGRQQSVRLRGAELAMQRRACRIIQASRCGRESGESELTAETRPAQRKTEWKTLLCAFRASAV